MPSIARERSGESFASAFTIGEEYAGTLAIENNDRPIVDSFFTSPFMIAPFGFVELTVTFSPTELRAWAIVEDSGW